MSDWKVFAPTTRRPVSKKFVSISKNNLTFSVGFVHHASLINFSKIVILVHEKLHRLGFQFSSSDSTGALSFYTSSGQKLCSARMLIATYPWLEEVVKRIPVKRQFVPEYDKKADMWFIDLKTVKK